MPDERNVSRDQFREGLKVRRGDPLKAEVWNAVVDVLKDLGFSGSRRFTNDRIPELSYVTACTVTMSTGAVGPPSTWKYNATDQRTGVTYTALTNQWNRNAALSYVAATTGAYGLLFWDGVNHYVFVNEDPTFTAVSMQYSYSISGNNWYKTVQNVYVASPGTTASVFAVTGTACT